MTGNLMGDFKRDRDLQENLPKEILLGINNHRLVDKSTDQFPLVKELKTLFSPQRRRFAGVISDISFDYFLIKHWSQFEQSEFQDFTQQSYKGLMQCIDWMPDRMQMVVQNMVKHDWLSTYSTLDGIGTTIDHVSNRIKFKNSMAGGVEEVIKNYQEIEKVFMQLFRHLIQTVKENRIEL